MHTSIANRTRRGARSGFTLIEMLVVIIIIGILSYFLITNLSGAKEQVEVSTTRNYLGQIAASLSVYSDEKGDVPRSQFKEEWGTPPNATNVGAECLYLALCAQGAPGFGTLDNSEGLCNSDGDSLSKRPKGFESAALFELADKWGNPIAYIHHNDYTREDLYVTIGGEAGEAPQELQEPVRAVKNEKTGRFYEPSGFQLISAGPDGKFGSFDDITNFTVK
jgi:prepilin-type N-terminal cleavage/methylation domain-containing protein